MQDYKYLYAAAVNIRDTLVNTHTHTTHTPTHRQLQLSIRYTISSAS